MNKSIQYPLIAAALAFAGSVQAMPMVSLAITNAGFESSVLPGDGASTGNGVITGWTLVAGGSADVFNPTAADFAGEAPEGFNVLRLGRGSVSQTSLSDVLEAGDYTLSMMVGDSALQAFTTFTVELLAGATVLASTATPTPADGSFALLTLDYTAAKGDALLGEALGIRLVDGLNSRSTLVYFDDVQLGFTAVPEPGALALIGMGLLAAAGAVRRKAKGS